MKSCSCRQGRQQGIALVQVLLLTAVFSVLLLSMVGYANSHQRQASAVDHQLQERFDLYSTASELQFNLLTQGWSDTGGEQNANAWAQHWNFYGQPFEVQGYTARIQNVGSLVNTYDAQNMARLLTLFGVESSEAQQMATTLRSWQRISDFERQGVLLSERLAQPGRLPIQHVREIELLNGWNSDIVNAVEQYITTINTGFLNPLYLPSEILDIAVTSGQAQALQQMRNSGTYNRSSFTRVTGISSDEFVSLFPGPTFQISLAKQGVEGVTRIELEATFEPYAEQPYSLRKLQYY